MNYPIYITSNQMAIMITSEEEFVKLVYNLAEYTSIEHGKNKPIVDGWLRDIEAPKEERFVQVIDQDQFITRYTQTLVRLNKKTLQQCKDNDQTITWWSQFKKNNVYNN